MNLLIITKIIYNFDYVKLQKYKVIIPTTVYFLPLSFSNVSNKNCYAQI
jgi:hypothetical protein